MLPTPFDKSVLIQVMVWCHQATSHCMNQCWTRSVPLNGVTRLQWVTVGSVISVTFLLLFTWKCVWFITTNTLFVTYFVAWVNNYCKSQIWAVRTITCPSFYRPNEDAMTRKTFCITGPLWGESTDSSRFPSQSTSTVELWCLFFLLVWTSCWANSCRWFATPTLMWRHCHAMRTSHC